jgi:D-glycero-alpha-D-manno-heptose-7-phosphate kinase
MIRRHQFLDPSNSSLLLPDVKIRSRAPLRLGFAGGGTDVSPYSDDFGGAVLNATIDHYAFAFIEPSSDGAVHFAAVDLGVEESFPPDLAATEKATLVLHAAVYRRMIRDYAEGRPLAIRIQTSVDAPAGSGLGSSSALVVALVDAFRTVLDVPLDPYETAHLAYEIERIELALAGGKQDQYAAAFGGINYIEFMKGGRVIVNPLRISRATLCELETSLIICFSGVSRHSEDIIDQQRKGMTGKVKRTLDSLHQLKAGAQDMKLALLRGNIPEMAQILGQSWQTKKLTATGISNPEIDRLYDVALAAGALAGKVSGAGGGGFIMFLAPPQSRLQVVRALNAAGGEAAGTHLTHVGVETWTITA